MNKAQHPEDDHWLRHSLLPSEPNLYKINESTGAPMFVSSHQCTCAVQRIPCTVGGAAAEQRHAGSWSGFASIYKGLHPDKYYIKLDDDIMFIRKGSFEAMLEEKLKGRFWLVSGNIVNHPSKHQCLM